MEEFPVDEIPLADEFAERGLKQCLELFVAQDWHFRWVGCREFVVTLPNNGVVFAGGVPGLGAVGCAAVSTVNLASKCAFAPTAAACSEFCLGEFPGFRVDDGRVRAGHILLGYFALVGFHSLGEEIDGECLL